MNNKFSDELTLEPLEQPNSNWLAKWKRGEPNKHTEAQHTNTHINVVYDGSLKHKNW